ncbi:hypothetical protein LTR37_005148 [Vermiconidia calcicola]|uniref:Uncharacterized protein n=1 Tax=Vermiconidia calcicola TaxID=1690605 RepID=A0ACC3NKZ9_9PEZI|nr:hypothetical protein LTR37_005148 [Vermiconidia calcicola]
MFGLSYWFLPAFAGTVWLGTLLGMLAYWLSVGSPHYESMGANQRVAYISDIGATFLQPLFIAGSTTMVVVFDLAFVSERWLRHKARLTPTYSKIEASLSVGAIFFAIIGAAGLILLSIFDTRSYPRAHDAFLGVFVLAYVVSAIFICAEYQRLGIHFREYRTLRISFWIKLAFIFIEIALAVAFGVTQLYSEYNISAYLEWIVSLVYIFYVWSFIIDFLPATKTRRPENRFPAIKKSRDPEAQRTQADGSMTGGPVYSNGGYSNGANSFASQPMGETGRRYEPPSRNF